LASSKRGPLDLTPYTLVLYTSAAAKEPSLKYIASSCRSAQIPLFYIRSVGFYGSFAAQLPPCFPVVDTHPDPESTSDLRLLKPWPALVEYASRKSRDLDKMDDHEHGHVPYLVLLLHYLEAWKEGHEGRVPSNYKEKNEFRALVREGMRTKNAEGGEENFEEAIGAVLKNLNDPAPSSAVTALFEAPEVTALATTVRWKPSVSECTNERSLPTFGSWSGRYRNSSKSMAWCPSRERCRT
jgi:amyloid beta precursor protein binding protein 1